MSFKKTVSHIFLLNSAAFLLICFLVRNTDVYAMDSGTKPVLPPVAICKNISVQPGTNGTVTITAADVDGGSYDPDGTITSRSVIPSSFTCAQKGANNVTLTVTDNEGLSASCTATVIVEDRTPPLMVCRNITLYLDPSGQGILSATDVNNGSTDNCGSTLILLLDRTRFDCSDVGSPVSVTLTGTDDSGNSSTCNATITVTDTISPSVNVKSFTLILNASGTGTLLPENVDNGSFDNCGPVTLSVLPNTFTCSDLGKKTVTLTALDSHGNSSSKSVEINVSSSLNIASMALSSCDLAPTLALFQADIEGGDGNYSWLWKGLEPASKPFMVIVPFPPSLQFYNTSMLQSPFFNNTMANGIYNIRLTVTDGNGCKDSSQIRINKTGIAFNNQTMRTSEACEGEIMIYSVNYKPDASYSWSVTNGNILSTNQDSSRIEVQWNLGVTTGKVVATLTEPNVLFPGGNCESAITDSVNVIPVPAPVFGNPALSVCSGSISTYTLAASYTYHTWNVTGGVITGGGRNSDNFVTVRWGGTPSGNITVTAGNSLLCQGSAVLNISVFNLTGKVTALADVKCNGGADGSVTIAADAGTGVSPYMYSVDAGTWQSDGTFTGLAVGNHTAHIRDALMCTFDIPFIITQPPKVAGMVSSQTDVSCFGGSNGSVTVTATGGTPPYQYSLNGGAYQNQNSFNGLSAGSFTITIRDNNNCTGSVPFTVSQPAAALAGSVNVTNVSCNGASTGAVNLTVTGGTPPYSYLWSNGRTTEDLVNIPAGNYSVVVTDSRNCTVTVPATVTQPATALSGSAAVTNVLCFGASTGAVNLTVTGGTPAYAFLWSNGATTEDLANVPAGNYSVTITDANGCTANTSATIAQPASALGGSVTSRTNVLCKGGNTGAVTVTGNGGTAPYQYRLGSGLFQASGTFSSLTAGTYSITVRDANLCTFTVPVTITEPALPLSGSISSQTNVLCFGSSTGSVTIAGSGGTTPYTYNIDGGSFQSSGTFGTLSAGNHTVVVRDNNLCTFSLPVIITQPASAVDGTITSQANVGCFGATTGSVTVAGSGGTPGYAYSIDGGAYQPSGTFQNLAAGNHTVSVRDINLCLKSIPVIITQPVAALSATLSKTDVACFGGSDGTATATASGGTSPYTYSWNTIPPQTGTTAAGLSAGTYTVTVTDANGCTISRNISVSQPAAPLSASVTITDVKCNGGSDGAINLTVTGAKMPVTYLWSNGTVTEDLTGLSAGSYSVQITDASGCTGNASGTVSQPEVLNGIIAVTNVACFGNSTGSCNLSVTGGTSPYTFQWNNGASSEDITNIPSGAYSVTITDRNLCTKVVNANVSQPAAALSGTITSQVNVSVYGGSDGSVTVSGSGGSAPYEYSLGSGAFQGSGIFNSLSAGSYIITIRDAQLCTFTLNVTITQPQIPLSAVIDSLENVLCAGTNSGYISISGWGGTSPYTYSLNGGPSQSSGVFGSLAAGNYLITITDFISDVFDTLIVITEPPALNISMTSTDNNCFGGSEGSATAAVTGGVEPYTYSWNSLPVQNTASATGLTAGLYTVSVTDANGCMISGSATINQPATEIAVGVTKTDVRCSGGSDGTATAQPVNGSAPYTYEWNTSPVQTTAEAAGLSVGTYTVTVTDASGCIKTALVEITEPAGMTIEPATTPATCPESSDGTITLTVTGGSQPYTFRWTDEVTTQNRTDIGAGNYTVEVTDKDLCTKSATVTVDFTGSFSCVVIPDLITPNNDGFNDEWRIKNIELYPEAEIKVYNRWGKLVFSTGNISANPWDGTIDGKPVPTDSYHYILRLNDGSKPISGVISVIR